MAIERGGVLTCYLSRESRHARPFLPDSLKEGREIRTAKGTMMFKCKHSISDITHVGHVGMVGNRRAEVIRKFICRDRGRRNGGFGTCMGGCVNSIRRQ